MVAVIQMHSYRLTYHGLSFYPAKIKDGWGKMKRGRAQNRRQRRSPFQEDE
jgi:hypothetical protein